jgi:hypothetical protein
VVVPMSPGRQERNEMLVAEAREAIQVRDFVFEQAEIGHAFDGEVLCLVCDLFGLVSYC